MSDNYENENGAYTPEDQQPQSAADLNKPAEPQSFDTQTPDAPTHPEAPQQPAQPTNPFYGRPQQPRQDPFGASPYGSPYSNRPQQNGPTYQPYGYNNPRTTPPKKKKSKGPVVAIVILILAVVVAFAAIVGVYIGKVHTGQENRLPTEQSDSVSEKQTTQGDAAIDYGTTNSANVEALSSVQVAEKCRKSVVGVMVYSNGKLAGEGSGVIMNKDASGKYTYIITCAHVVSGGKYTYGILTLDEKRYEAELVAYDTRTDIGVLKVEANDLPAAEFGNSDSLRVGETVYAIGNPGGSEYFGSITNGIVSAIDRSVSSTYTMTCIQHNAAINPGNSGGALVNSAGQVIGINSSKIADTDYEGMGFAVPMSVVKPIVESLIQYKYVPNRPKLGIQYASVSSYQLYSMVVAIKGLPAGSLVIAGISTDSSLSKTNAQVGDLIIAVNGKKMDDSSVLLDLINTGAVGDTLTLTLCRVESRTYKTSTFDVTITLVEDKGVEEETTTESVNGYNYGGAGSFEDFFKEYFGNFGW